jgi:hypothetical protein
LLRGPGSEGSEVREFVVDLTGVTTAEGFLAAFNAGFCRHVGGELHTLNWNAFNDYLSWPEEERYWLLFRGWKRCRGVHRRVARETFREHPHVEVVFQESATPPGELQK